MYTYMRQIHNTNKLTISIHNAAVAAIHIISLGLRRHWVPQCRWGSWESWGVP